MGEYGVKLTILSRVKEAELLKKARKKVYLQYE